MSEDLIRRSDAIKAINLRARIPHDIASAQYASMAINAICSVPTIEPEHGEWIFKTIFPNDKSEFPMGYLECSVCGSHHRNVTPCNYCDNCGADMRG